MVKARRSRSCSVTGRKQATKKLVFQQLRLAQEPGLRSCPPASGLQPSACRPDDAAAEIATANVPAAASHKPKSAACTMQTQLGQAKQSIADDNMSAAKSAGSAAVETFATAAVTGRASHMPPDAAASNKVPEQHRAGLARDRCRPVDNHGAQGHQRHREADGTNAGSPERWQAAVSELYRLAEKHSQESQEDNAANAAADPPPGPGASLKPAAVPGDLHPAPPEGQSPPICCDVLPAVEMLRLPQQAAMHGTACELSHTAAHVQAPSEMPCINAVVVENVFAPRTSDLSSLKAVMRQQQQQQRAESQSHDTVQKPDAEVAPDAETMQARQAQMQPPRHEQSPHQKSRLQHQEQGHQQSHEHQEQQLAAPPQGEQGHKRKWSETGHAADGMQHNSASGELLCKKQCIAPSGLQRTLSTAADDASADAALPSSTAHCRQLAEAAGLLVADQPALRDVAGTGTGTGPSLVSQVVAWPVCSEPERLQAPKPQSVPINVVKASATRMRVVSTTNAVVGVSAEVAAAAMPADAVEPAAQLASAADVRAEQPAAQAAAAVIATDAQGEQAAQAHTVIAAVAEAEQHNRLTGPSEVQQAPLRLDLSSEEEPLLCTQRLPSSQGKTAQCTLPS